MDFETYETLMSYLGFIEAELNKVAASQGVCSFAEWMEASKAT